MALSKFSELLFDREFCSGLSGDKMTPSPATSQATTQSGNHNRGPSTPQTPGNHPSQKGAADRTQHPSVLPQAPVSGNADSIAADLEHDNLPDEFNFGVLEGDHGGGTDGVEGALDVSFFPKVLHSISTSRLLAVRLFS